jgi:hypothetical protein
MMIRILGIALVVLVTIPLVGWVALRFADGPRGPLRGGALQDGELIDEPDVKWQATLGDRPVGEIELQLVEPVGSRTVGAFVHEGDLYVPCDLGFIWRRVPSDNMRRVLHLIWLLKSWHKDAVADGRVVVRVAGKRFERQAVRITDPALLATFRDRVSQAAGEYMGGLLPIETNSEDIWFFRLDPRPSAERPG